MGTLVRIVVYAADSHTARAALSAGFNRIRELDQVLSDYRSDSELSRVRHAPAAQPVPISDDLFAVLKVAQDVAMTTNGAYDVTLGPVTRLWRSARRTRTLPAEDELADAAARTGFTKLTLDAVSRTATMEVPGMVLDAGGIGKGHAASEALGAMTRLGVASALVAVSGDIAFSAPPPGQRGWRIDLPGVSNSTSRERLELKHAAVSTSGPERQFVAVDDVRYSHIINPADHMGLRRDLTVTVIAPTGGEADALATAVSVLGPERGLAVLDARVGVSGIVLDRSGPSLRVYRSARFPAGS